MFCMLKLKTRSELDNVFHRTDNCVLRALTLLFLQSGNNDMQISASLPYRISTKCEEAFKGCVEKFIYGEWCLLGCYAEWLL
jgi:hypothetical protein